MRKYFIGIFLFITSTVAFSAMSTLPGMPSKQDLTVHKGNSITIHIKKGTFNVKRGLKPNELNLYFNVGHSSILRKEHLANNPNSGYDRDIRMGRLAGLSKIFADNVKYGKNTYACSDSKVYKFPNNCHDPKDCSFIYLEFICKSK